MRQEHIDRFVEGGRKARALLDRYDNDLLDKGYTIVKTTTRSREGHYHSRTEYIKPEPKDDPNARQIAHLEKQIAEGAPSYIRAPGEYIGQLKCDLMALRKEQG